MTPSTCNGLPFAILWYLQNRLVGIFIKQIGDEYSHTKLNFILSVMGWTYSQFSQKNFYYVSPSVCVLTRMELQKRADEGNPVRELDGSLMQLGSDYLVDYSAYE